MALIIGDDDKPSIVYPKAQRQAEFGTRVIHDGAEALAQLPTSQSAVIIVDLHLPHVSGNQILGAIRQTKILVRTRVIRRAPYSSSRSTASATRSGLDQAD